MLLPLSAAMAAQSPSLVPFEVGGGYLNFSSDNGHWATYKEPSGEGEAMPDPVGHIVDLQTGKTIDLVDPSLSETDGVECYDITNDGKLVVGCLNRCRQKCLYRRQLDVRMDVCGFQHTCRLHLA